MFIRKDRQREVDQKNEGDSGMQEFRQESGFKTTDSGVDDNYNGRHSQLPPP
jgi:hypothetical protein